MADEIKKDVVDTTAEEVTNEETQKTEPEISKKDKFIKGFTKGAKWVGNGAVKVLSVIGAIAVAAYAAGEITNKDKANESTGGSDSSKPKQDDDDFVTFEDVSDSDDESVD